MNKLIIGFILFLEFYVKIALGQTTPTYNQFEKTFNNAQTLSKQSLYNLTGAYESEYVYIYENDNNVLDEELVKDQATVFSFLYNSSFTNKNSEGNNYNILFALHDVLQPYKNLLIKHWYFWSFIRGMLSTGGSNYILKKQGSVVTYFSSSGGYDNFLNPIAEFCDFDPTYNGDFVIKTNDSEVYRIKECTDKNDCNFIVKYNKYYAKNTYSFEAYVKMKNEISTCTQIPKGLFPIGANKCP